MRLGILNEKLGICTIEGLRDLDGIQEQKIVSQMPDGAKPGDLAFFYMSDRDWIVINMSHELYEYYAQIIQDYLELSEEGRKQAAERAPVEEVSRALQILDDVIWRRKLIYGETVARMAVLEKKERSQEMRVDNIKIYPCFAAHPPRAEKMEQKEQYFAETGLLQSQIILDSQGNLIDGYTSYLLAKAHGIQSVPIRYGKRQIVRASHKPGGKLYSWELPGLLIDRVSVGNKVLVHTQRGIRVATVAAVEDFAGQEQEPLRMVVKVKKKRHNAAVRRASTHN